MNRFLRVVIATFAIVAAAFTTIAAPATAVAAPSPQVIIRQDVPSVTKTQPLEVRGAFYVEVTRVPSDTQAVLYFESKQKGISAAGPYVILPMQGCVCSFSFDESGQPYLQNGVVYRAVVVIGTKTITSDWFVPILT